MKKKSPFIFGIALSLFLGISFGNVTFVKAKEISGDLVDLVLEKYCEYAENQGEDCFKDKGRDPQALQELAQNADAPFQNLYLFTYQNIVKAPAEAALSQLAQVESMYSKNELEAILFEDDFSPINERAKMTPEEVAQAEADLKALEEEMNAKAAQLADEESGINEEFLAFMAQSNYINAKKRLLETNSSVGTQEYLLNEVASLQKAYEAELDFQMENRQLAYQSYATEIFFDNDLGNSANIDILYDLDLINYLLFGKFIDYPDRSGTDNESVQLSSEENVTALLPSVTFIERDTNDINSTDTEDVINPYVCLEDESLQEALDAYETYEKNKNQDSDAIATESEVQDSSPANMSENPETAALRENFENFVDSLSAQEGDWSRSLPCDDVFCITVNLVQDSWGSSGGSSVSDYDANEDCIACHLEYIAAATTDTLNGGVQANKVPQNWFEDGTCKSVADGLNLDLNVYSMPVPIPTDLGDDIDDDANKAFNETVDALIDWSYLNNVNAAGQTPTEFEQENYLNNLNLSGQTESMDTALEALTEIEIAKKEALENIIAEQDLKVKVKSSYELYNQMEEELNSILIYFQNYSDWLKDTYVDEQAPLNQLIKKPYCP